MNKIIVGNSITLIKSIETASIHAIISDIPYGISYDDWDVLHNNTNSALGGASSAQLAGGSLFKRRGSRSMAGAKPTRRFLWNIKIGVLLGHPNGFGC